MTIDYNIYHFGSNLKNKGSLALADAARRRYQIPTISKSLCLDVGPEIKRTADGATLKNSRLFYWRELY